MPKIHPYAAALASVLLWTATPAFAGNDMTVTASAYTARPAETDSKPRETACKDKLEQGDKTVAVSEDLFEAGLTCGARIRIEGMDGDYLVNDKLPDKHHRQIDIFMGTGGQAVREAKEWGERKVRITWTGGGNGKTMPTAQ